MRLGLLVSSGLAFIAGLQLYVGTEKTDRYFAWTIEPPLSAAFLGGTYWGALVLLLLASRERIWAASRATTVATLLLVSLLLLVTIVHIDKFHTDSSSALTLAGTWAFVAAYIVLPIGLMVLLAHQLRQPGDDPPRSSRLPAWARATIVVHGGVLLVVGALLLAAPATTRGVWPWMLTPLMGRAVGAWLLAVGVALALALREDDWWRVRGPLVGYGALAILQFVALARYSGTPDWGTPQSWIFVAFLASMILFAVAGYLEARRVGTPGGVSTGPKERVVRIDNDR
jgi:hypothetical protein